MSEKIKHKCPVPSCNQESKILKTHLKEVHNLTPKECYDLYLKKDKDDICQLEGCNNLTKFKNIREGYHKHCCCKCTQLDPETKEKSNNTYKERTGYTHNSRNPENWIKMKENDPDYYKKRLDAVMTYWNNITDEKLNDRREKREETNLKNHGIKNPFMDSSYIQDCFEKKYGVRSPAHVPEFQKKKEETSLKNWGNKSFLGSKECKEIYRKNKQKQFIEKN